MRPAFLIAVLTLSLAVPTAAQTPQPRKTDPKIADGSARRALDKAKSSWSRAAIRSYRYEIKRICFCPQTGYRVVSVSRGQPSKRTAADVADVSTVPRIHRLILKLIRAKPAKLDVRYGTYGVPTRIAVDPIPNAVDDEFTYAVRRFKRR